MSGTQTTAVPETDALKSEKQRVRVGARSAGRKPTIALLTNYPYDGKTFTGGVETATAGLLEGLQRHAGAFDFHVFTLVRGIPRHRVETRMGMTFHFLAIPHRWYQRPNVIPNVINACAALRELKPDLVHCQDNMALAVATLAAKPLRKIFTVHGIKVIEARVWEGPEYWSYQMDAVLERWVHRHFDEVIAISPYVDSFLPLHVKKFHIPNAVQNLFFESPQHGDVDVHRLLFVAAITRLKRPLDAIRAFARVRQKFPDAVLTIVGPMFDAPYEREMMNFVAETQLSGVEFLGACTQERIAHIMRESSALVLPSAQENSPMVIAEAMASGLPVIASRVGGIPAMIASGEDGLLFEYGNIDQLTERFTQILEDAELRAHLAKHGRVKAESLFSVDAVAEATVRVYKTLMGDVL